MGVDPLDAFLDLSLADDLEMQFVLAAPPTKTRHDAVTTMMSSPVMMAGSSDGGAHLLSFCGADFTTRLLTEWVPAVLTLEQAVARLTSIPAAAAGITDRGVLTEGAPADVNVIDRDAIAGRRRAAHRARLPRRQRPLRRRRRGLRRHDRQRRAAARSTASGPAQCRVRSCGRDRTGTHPAVTAESSFPQLPPRPPRSFAIHWLVDAAILFVAVLFLALIAGIPLIPLAVAALDPRRDRGAVYSPRRDPRPRRA